MTDSTSPQVEGVFRQHSRPGATDRLGGSLSVESTIGRGNAFTIDVPTAQGPVERFERLNQPAVPEPTRVNYAASSSVDDLLRERVTT